ncbi:MAG: adenylate/guanylate cyclase domain-containing protein [Chloroflexota bacterium]
MTDRQEIVQAIAALETQRAVLGNDVVDTALIALRDRLAILQTPQFTEQHQIVTVLVADLSGFTAMSERMDVEEIGETMNQLWERLDGVVEAWGGTVDKHAGDSLIALFGLPFARDDDAERAVQAALAMQIEMALYNRGSSFGSERSELRWGRARPRLQMRIGINSGPVYFGRVGNAEKLTAVGDTVNVATQLEELAPLGKVLTSESVYRQVQSLYDAEPLEFEATAHGLDLERAYIIQRSKPLDFREPYSLIKSLGTRLVGRTSELGQLEYALQTTIDSSTAQVVTIVGDGGVGKTRLLHEFEQRLQLLPQRVRVFRGQGQAEMGRTAYSLVGSWFTSHFAIHARHSPEVAREKFVQGMLEVLSTAEADVKPDALGYHPTPVEQAYLVGQLIGFEFKDNLFAQGINYDSHRIREHAFENIARFFRAVTEQSPGVVLILEDMHWADEGSFELLEYLVKECWDIPLMVVCLARPLLYEKRPSWQTLDSLDPMTYLNLTLSPLSPIDSRHLVTDMLSKLPRVPLRIVDLVVSWANGTPYYIEAFMQLLLEKKIIVSRGKQWQVKMGKLADMRVPSTLGDLHRERVSALPKLESEVLRRAAVVGRVFWDTAIMQLGELEDSITTEEIEVALKKLVERGFIYLSQTAAFAGTREFVFAHDSLHQAVYGGLKFTKRLHYHSQAATWLVAYRGTDTGYYRQDPPEYASVIATHFERAGEMAKAVDWYGRAGHRARERYTPETAVTYYRRALDLLNDESGMVNLQLSLNMGLGKTLRQLARFDKAIAAFAQIQKVAEHPRDEASAFYEIVLTRLFKDVPKEALVSAQLAEEAARQADSVPHLILALAVKAWTMLCLDDVPTALKLCQEALGLGKEAGATRETAVVNGVMGRICWQLERFNQARIFIKEALDSFYLSDDRFWIAMLLRHLGDIAQKEGESELAAKHYEDSLRTSRDIGDYHGTMLCWQQLANLKQVAMAFDEAETFLQQALLVAEKSGNRERLTEVGKDLGDLYIARADNAPSLIHRDHYLDQARIWFDKALDWAELTESQILMSRVEAGFARLMMAETAV